jgi:diaminopimelate decarboxylase
METPYFVFKQETLKKNYLEFEKLCKEYLGNYVIAYSVKTNSFESVIDVLSDLGSNFEVASLSEMKKALNFSLKSFVFNSCCKTEEEIKLAIKKKFLINIDSKSEINRISGILDDLGISSLSVGLRVSLNDSKFGFGNDKLKENIEYCNERGIKVISLHFHGGTQKNINDFEENLKRINEIVRTSLNYGIQLKYLDLGGGFPDKFQLKNLSLGLKDYFKLIEKYTREFDTGIILEPGRCLVADAFDLITKVCVLKEKNEKSFAILNVGINVLSKITMAGYKFKKIETEVFGDKKDYVLAGPLLFNNDILGKFYGNLMEGDLIRVENVGAYCYNLSWEISYSKPKVYVE